MMSTQKLTLVFDINGSIDLSEAEQMEIRDLVFAALAMFREYSSTDDITRIDAILDNENAGEQINDSKTI